MRTLSLADAVALIPDGASLMIGGFMAVGTPEDMVDELVRQGKRDLTVIGNDTALPGVGIGKLVRARLVTKAIVSHIGLNPDTQAQIAMQHSAKGESKLVKALRAGEPSLNMSSTTELDLTATEAKYCNDDEDVIHHSDQGSQPAFNESSQHYVCRSSVAVH
jgi:acyl CoA:acetate/3-ketoacid CoA transferase alpha subunit